MTVSNAPERLVFRRLEAGHEVREGDAYYIPTGSRDLLYCVASSSSTDKGAGELPRYILEPEAPKVKQGPPVKFGAHIRGITTVYGESFDIGMCTDVEEEPAWICLDEARQKMAWLTSWDIAAWEPVERIPRQEVAQLRAIKRAMENWGQWND